MHNRTVRGAAQSETLRNKQSHGINYSMVRIWTGCKRFKAAAAHEAAFHYKIMEQTEQTECTKIATLNPMTYSVK